jgi:predicted glycosyltransferase involved in capsule biosynthesis
MNRERPLKVSLQSWLLEDRIDEILIVDWSSSKPLKYLEKIDKRIKVFRIENQKHFHLGKSYNSAIRFSSCKHIMKMDVDYVINPYTKITEILPPPKDCFYTGNWQLHQYDGDMGFLRYTNGFIYANRSDFLQVGGYREDLIGYGFEDSDLYARLQAIGLTHNTLNLHKIPFLFHIPHDNKSRSENYEEKDIHKSSKRNEATARKPLSANHGIQSMINKNSQIDS